MPRVLKSLDLFSGIGGLTHALRGVCHPVGYCDIDAHCRAVLKARMKSGHLPEAPVFEDVVDLDISMMGKGKKNRVDIIVGGWPCIGHSNLGKRKGLENEHSALFTHIMRLADELQPPFLFLENVPPVLFRGMDTVADAILSRGYDMRWCVVHSGVIDGNSPQERKRWYCLCSKRDLVDPPVLRVAKDMDPFCYGEEPVPRMKVEWDSKIDTQRIRQLGNSVIPDAARAAFFMLWTGKKHPRTAAYAPGLKEFVPFAAYPKSKDAVVVGGDEHWPQFGCCTLVAERVSPRKTIMTPKIYTTSPPKIPVQKNWNLVLDPRAYDGTVVNAGVNSSPLVQEEMLKGRWSTPRTNAHGISHSLTERSSRDLGTQLRFEKNTPDELRRGKVNPQFLEWMMGFPTDWTLI